MDFISQWDSGVSLLHPPFLCIPLPVSFKCVLFYIALQALKWLSCFFNTCYYIILKFALRFSYTESTYLCFFILFRSGIEVKPGRPCPYHADNVRGKLHVTQVLHSYTQLLFLFFIHRTRGSWISVVQETLSFWSCKFLSVGVPNNCCCFSLIICMKVWNVISTCVLIWTLDKFAWRYYTSI